MSRGTIASQLKWHLTEGPPLLAGAYANGRTSPTASNRAAFLCLLAADRARLRHELSRQLEAEGLRGSEGGPEKGRLIFENRVYRWALESQARSQVAGMELLLLRAIRTLAHALEAKDAYTWGHSARVSEYAAVIGRELGLSEEEISIIRLGGELHDVGKIGVPEELLGKPGRLSTEEYRQIMEHTVIGTRILKPLLGNHPKVLAVVRSHHERLDGASLPDGLEGDEIPLAAKIVSVADAFDAMTSVRPYRSALGVRAALQELDRNAGTQFDGECVRAAEKVCRAARDLTHRWKVLGPGS